VNGLEHELRALAPSIDWPEAPDVRPAVAAQIAERRMRRRLAGRLALVVAVAVLALVAATLAVPQARTAIFDWLGIGGARIGHIDELPVLAPVVPLDVLGEPVTLGEARADAGFAFAAPPEGEPAPGEIRVAAGQRVSYVWRDDKGVRAVVTQVPAGLGEEAVIQKLLPPQTTVEELEIDGYRAVWLEGGPHAVFLAGPDDTLREDRGWLAGNTLLVDRDGVTIRVEGALDRERAVELVRKVRG